jgi:hypothetical protein
MRSSFIDYQSPFPPPDAKPKPSPKPKPITTQAVGEEQGQHVLPPARGERR